MSLPPGKYRVTWNAPDCTYLDVRWSPATGSETVIVRLGFDGTSAMTSSGSVAVDLGGDGYLNRTADCDYGLELDPA